MKAPVLLLPGAAVTMLVLAACAPNAATPAGSASSAAGRPSTPTASPAPAAAAATSPAATAMTAEQVVGALTDLGLPVTLGTVFTAATDPNHLLGRPGEYTSKAGFTDSRLGGGKVAQTGSVEVFASPADATRRALYLQSVIQADPAQGTEYDYVAGPIVLRVPGKLTAAQAHSYEAALHVVTGLAVSQPSPAST